MSKKLKEDEEKKFLPNRDINRDPMELKDNVSSMILLSYHLPLQQNNTLMLSFFMQLYFSELVNIIAARVCYLWLKKEVLRKVTSALGWETNCMQNDIIIK